MKIWIVSGENATSTGTSGAGCGSSRPRPGAATKKSSRWLRPDGEVSSMNPPAPGPVSSDSDANDTSTAATAASTALPPARSTSAPASAVTSCPAATTPLMRGRRYLLGGLPPDVPASEANAGWVGRRLSRSQRSRNRWPRAQLMRLDPIAG